MGKKYIIENIQNMAGKYTPYQIFSDWTCMMSLVISNSCSQKKDDVYLKREKLYLDIVSKYSRNEKRTMAAMMSALSLCLEEFEDVLGDIYMKAGCGSKSTGQFFTPYHISHLTANLVYGSKIDRLKENDFLKINEPSCGSGGMLIALAHVMKDKGVNYQKKLCCTAQDLDWNGVYMTYVQLSLLGIKAIVVQGDTLKEPYCAGYDDGRVFKTPAYLGVIF